MVGIVFSLLAALGFGASAVLARLGLQHLRVTTVTLATLVVGATLTMALALSLHASEILNLSGTALLWLLMAGMASPLLGRFLNFTGVHLAGVSRASTIVGAWPLFATALAVTIAGESLNTPILLGTVSIIGGLVLILSQR